LLEVAGDSEHANGQFTVVFTTAEVLLPGFESPLALIEAWLLMLPQHPLPTVPVRVMVADPLPASVGMLTVTTLPAPTEQAPAPAGDTEQMTLLRQSGRSSVTTTPVALPAPILLAVRVYVIVLPQVTKGGPLLLIVTSGGAVTAAQADTETSSIASPAYSSRSSLWR
jgi:hypothetical protein